MATRHTPTAPAPAAPATPPTLIPIPEWPHPWPPIGGLRWLAFNAESNGFASAFVRVGRRVLVDESEFFRCVERGRAAKPHPTKRLKPLSAPRPVEILDEQEGAA